jgi:mannose-6-phosphate isomerase-like protein (cupin superfamily)
MFAFLRPSLPPKTNRAGESLIVYEDGASFLEFRQTGGSDYLLRNQHPPFNKDNPSIMVPPFHFHLHQTEHFRIVSGECHLFKDTADKPWKTLSAQDPQGLKTAFIPPNEYHTINNASTTEPLVLDVSLTPEDVEGEERFFRNFFGYLDDCRKAGQQPSIFQLMVFLRSSDTPLGLPVKPKWLALLLSRMFMHSMGFFGRWILGYQSSYEEYYHEKKF